MSTTTIDVWWQRRQRRRRAGSRARERYRLQHKAWLREHRRHWALFALVGAAVVTAFSLLVGRWPGDQSWLCGFSTGSVVTVFLALRQSPPGGVQRWQEGAWGEELTAEELAPSDGGEWNVLHDLERGTYNTDHVVIGHHGVYCLNSKNSIDRLEVADRGRALRRTNRYDPEVVSTDDRLLSRARGEACELSGLIRERTGIRTWVTPVVVWWGPFGAGSAVVDGVLVVQGRQLVAALRQQPSRPVHDVSAIVEALQPVPARGSWRVRWRPEPEPANA